MRRLASAYHFLHGVTVMTVFAGILAGIFVLVTFSGCILKRTTAPEDFTREEKLLADRIRDATDPDALSDYYLRRARLRLRAENPRPDYQGALYDLKRAVDLKPERWRVSELKDWIATLNRLGDLERQNRALRLNIEQLEKQGQELRKTIEELQTLELQMEQRRRLLR